MVSAGCAEFATPGPDPYIFGTFFYFRDILEAATRAKKEPPFPAAFEVDNREASNRVDRSHSVSKRGRPSHNRESLIVRKRTVSFKVCLPCRPLAECGVSCPGCCAAPSARSRASSTRYGSRRGALLIPGPAEREAWVPALRRSAKRRCTASGTRDPSRLEETGGRLLRGALLGHGHLQPLDLGGHQRDPLSEFLDRQQREVLPDLVGDFLSRLVVILDGHVPCSMLHRR